MNYEVMEKQIKEIFRKYRQNEGYHLSHAESEILNLFAQLEGSLYYSFIDQNDELQHCKVDKKTVNSCSVI